MLLVEASYLDDMKLWEDREAGLDLVICLVNAQPCATLSTFLRATTVVNFVSELCRIGGKRREHIESIECTNFLILQRIVGKPLP